MARRRYAWKDIALMARKADGVWRLHPDLVAVNIHLLHHARRRVRALRKDKGGHFEFARRNNTVDRYGMPVFDLFIRYVPEGTEP
jgi:hypothetical protein